MCKGAGRSWGEDGERRKGTSRVWEREDREEEADGVGDEGMSGGVGGGEMEAAEKEDNGRSMGVEGGLGRGLDLLGGPFRMRRRGGEGGLGTATSRGVAAS